MKQSTDLKFDLYRYQINPIRRDQLSLFGEAVTFDELKEKKNQIFADEILKNPPKQLRGKGEYYQKGYYNEKNMFMFKIASKKNIIHHTKELEDEFLDDYPFVYVMVNNNPNSQKIAISRNHKAFNSSQTVANILENNFGDLLFEHDLSFSLTPILDEHDYWSLLDKYKDRIYEIRFDIIRPNITNLSKALKKGIKNLASSTNSLRTRVELTAPDKQTLDNIDESNEQIEALSKYSLNGGGDVSFKAKGVKGRIETSRSIRTYEVDSIQIDGSPEQVAQTFKNTIGK